MFTDGFWNMTGIGLCLFLLLVGNGIQEYLKRKVLRSKLDREAIQQAYDRGYAEGFQDFKEEATEE